MISTFRRSSCLASVTFSRLPNRVPAACSPSRSVVSKTATLSGNMSSLMFREHGLYILAQCRLAPRAAVEHVAARILMHGDTRGIAHYRHLVDGQDRAHERAGEIVPAMHD